MLTLYGLGGWVRALHERSRIPINTVSQGLNLTRYKKVVCQILLILMR